MATARQQDGSRMAARVAAARQQHRGEGEVTAQVGGDTRVTAEWQQGISTGGSRIGWQKGDSRGSSWVVLELAAQPAAGWQQS